MFTTAVNKTLPHIDTWHIVRDYVIISCLRTVIIIINSLNAAKFSLSISPNSFNYAASFRFSFVVACWCFCCSFCSFGHNIPYCRQFHKTYRSLFVSNNLMTSQICPFSDLLLLVFFQFWFKKETKKHGGLHHAGRFLF